MTDSTDQKHRVKISDRTRLRYVRAIVIKGFARYRRVYPADVKPYLGDELTESLETIFEDEATTKRDRLNGEYERRVVWARDMIARGIPPSDKPPATTKPLMAIVERWKEREQREYTSGLAARMTSRDPETSLFLNRVLLKSLVRGDKLPIPTDPRPDLNGDVLIDDFTPMRREMELAGLTDPADPMYRDVAKIIGNLTVQRAQERITSGSPETAQHAPVSFDTMVEAWFRKSKRKNKKSKSLYGLVARRLKAHVGHGDVSRVTRADVVGWRNAMLDDPFISPMIVEDHIGKLRTLFKAIVDDDDTLTDPAATVTYICPPELRTTFRGYTDDEARKNLIAARLHKDPVIRWTPWIGQFTGGRISEICGAPAKAVSKKDGIWCIFIDPKNREKKETLKNTESARDVPLHPALIEEGFLKYVESLDRNGPLFPNLPPDMYGKRGGNGSKRVSRWVRGVVGIKDLEIQPTHAWRHRLGKVMKDLRIEKGIRYAIRGHTMSDAGEGYEGDYPISQLYEAICKILNPAA